MHTAAVYASHSFMAPLPTAPGWVTPVCRGLERKARTVPMQCVSERLVESSATGEAGGTRGLSRSDRVALTRSGRRFRPQQAQCGIVSPRALAVLDTNCRLAEGDGKQHLEVARLQIYTVVPSIFERIRREGRRPMTSVSDACVTSLTPGICYAAPCLTSNLDGALAGSLELGGLIMKTWMLVFVIGISTAPLGCVTKTIPEGSFQQVRLAGDHRSTDTASAPSRTGAITVNADQIFGE